MLKSPVYMALWPSHPNNMYNMYVGTLYEFEASSAKFGMWGLIRFYSYLCITIIQSKDFNDSTTFIPDGDILTFVCFERMFDPLSIYSSCNTCVV